MSTCNSRVRFLVAYLIAAFCIAPAALADGKMFAVEVADVSGAQIPDQAAMICWDPATKAQTLAIETRFVGKGTEFGWVVPLPSRPEVTPGTKGMFPSLRGMFAPVVQTRGAGATPLLIGLLFLALAMLYAKGWVEKVAGVLVALLIVTMVLLPSLGTARSSLGGPVAAPDFVDRRIVGDFEVTTLESPEGAVVVEWLRSHTFHVPVAAEKVIDQYAKEKWSFVATRLVREGDTAEASTAHPLVFTFTTDAPVYPMRLTGADANRDLSVELFVFGPSRATAAGFGVAAAGEVYVAQEPQHVFRMRPSAKVIKVAHSAIGPHVAPAKWATRLTATLTPAQMTNDAQIDWTEGGPTGRSVQSWQTAGGIGLDVGLTAMFIVLCIVGHYEQKRGLPRFTALRWGVIAAVCVGVVTFAALPKVTTTSLRQDRQVFRQLEQALGEYLRYDTKSENGVPFARACEAFDQVIAARTNTSQQMPSRGDAPGQADLRVTDGMIWLVSVNAAGVEQWDGLFPTGDPDSK